MTIEQTAFWLYGWITPYNGLSLLVSNGGVAASLECSYKFSQIFRKLWELALRQTTGFAQPLWAVSGLSWIVPSLSTLCRKQPSLDMRTACSPSWGLLKLLLDFRGIKFLAKTLVVQIGWRGSSASMTQVAQKYRYLEIAGISHICHLKHFSDVASAQIVDTHAINWLSAACHRWRCVWQTYNIGHSIGALRHDYHRQWERMLRYVNALPLHTAMQRLPYVGTFNES